MKIIKLLIAIVFCSFIITANAAKQQDKKPDGWNLFCQANHCQSLYTNKAFDNKKSLLIAYSYGMLEQATTNKKPSRSIVININQIQLSKLKGKNTIQLSADNGPEITIPVISISPDGITAAVTNPITVTTVCNTLQYGKELTITFTQAGHIEPTKVKIPLFGFTAKIDSMPSCNQS